MVLSTRSGRSDFLKAAIPLNAAFVKQNSTKRPLATARNQEGAALYCYTQKLTMSCTGDLAMRRRTANVIAAFVALVSGCANTGQYGPKARAIDYEEASAFERERSLPVRAVPVRQPPAFYTQPANKQEPCKLPTSQDQLARSNFVAYWDGQCKDGYAFGLGRDIAISDTHHIEEIITYGINGDASTSPRVIYDYVNNSVMYATPGEKYPAESVFTERIDTTGNSFMIAYQYGVTDALGYMQYTEYSPLRLTRFYIYDIGTVFYRFTDNSAIPVVDPNMVTFSGEILDPKTRKAGGVVVVRHGSGQVRHLKLTGAGSEEVRLPADYFNQLSEKLMAAQNAPAAANAGVERARQMEREYLYMACNGKHTITGLAKETATKICTWRDQFKAQYEAALAQSTRDLETQKQKAATVERQRAAQQQNATQQARLQQQQSQQELQQAVNAFSQLGQQMQSAGQQMLNSTMSQPTPQVTPFAPFAPLGGNQVRCVNSGSVTNCRY